jgi:hypothetical protein
MIPTNVTLRVRNRPELLCIELDAEDTQQDISCNRLVSYHALSCADFPILAFSVNQVVRMLASPVVD